jgi:DnaK suppressor protein
MAQHDHDPEPGLDLDAIRRQLEHRRRGLIDRITRAATDASQVLASRDVELVERATDEWSAQVLDFARERDEHELAAVDGALGRLDDGRYGFCEVCGQPIEAARLLALPETERCLAHAPRAAQGAPSAL